MAHRPTKNRSGLLTVPDDTEEQNRGKQSHGPQPPATDTGTQVRPATKKGNKRREPKPALKEVGQTRFESSD